MRKFVIGGAVSAVLLALACGEKAAPNEDGPTKIDGKGGEPPVVVETGGSKSGSGGSSSGGSPGSGGSATGGASSDCFENPKTHFEIINACTKATKVKKTPELTLLNEDGSLPPL